MENNKSLNEPLPAIVPDLQDETEPTEEDPQPPARLEPLSLSSTRKDLFQNAVYRAHAQGLAVYPPKLE